MEKFISLFDRYETILWDWNGTLLNDVDFSLSITNKQRMDQGLEALPKEQLKKLFCFPIREYYRRIGLGQDDASFGKLASDFIETYKKSMDSLPLFDETEKLLNKLSDREQFIISAAEETHLKGFVNSHGLNKFFTECYGLDGIHAHSKEDRCKELIKDFKIDPSKTLLVGDTAHDAEVAESAGLDVLLIADGFHHYDNLEPLGVSLLKTRFDHF